MPSTILLIDDHAMFREGLFLALREAEPSMHIETALEAGAHGFVHKSADSQQLLHALRRVIAGEQNVVQASPQSASPLPVLSTPADILSQLTLRQTEVLHLLCEGLRNAQIAERLETTEKTVKAHISAIFAAPGVSNRTQAAMAARRAGLLGKPR